MNTDLIHIRPADNADMAAVAAIFNHAVRHTLAIWQEQETDEANRIQWLAQRQANGFPVLVAVNEQNTVLGYGSYGDFRAYSGYRHTVEHSIYVHQTAQRKGIGRLLLQALIDDAVQQKKHVMVAAIEAGNAASVSLHQKMGFVQSGLMPQVGCKFGKWLDLVLMQKILQHQ
ncbi:GNAT family N-acetyltransferase [Stenoxybacter acetivorans]|uniref:GNAT family N-acetyltransferase n=1 Tax=Stenoxybacter acetivorans TaxID=422441 RepID=UPI00056918B0|nr:GNAT family N-acetyltransferase [Stenoxybacter acetivorans]